MFSQNQEIVVDLNTQRGREVARFELSQYFNSFVKFYPEKLRTSRRYNLKYGSRNYDQSLSVAVSLFEVSINSKDNNYKYCILSHEESFNVGSPDKLWDNNSEFNLEDY